MIRWALHNFEYTNHLKKGLHCSRANLYKRFYVTRNTNRVGSQWTEGFTNCTKRNLEIFAEAIQSIDLVRVSERRIPQGDEVLLFLVSWKMNAPMFLFVNGVVWSLKGIRCSVLCLSPTAAPHREGVCQSNRPGNSVTSRAVKCDYDVGPSPDFRSCQLDSTVGSTSELNPLRCLRIE